MANNVFGKIQERFERRRAERRIDQRINKYESDKKIISRNSHLNTDEANRIITMYNKTIDTLRTCKNKKEYDIVKTFSRNDSDISHITNEFFNSNRGRGIQNNVDGGRIERNAANPNDVQHIRTQDYYPQEVINRYAQNRPPLNPVEIERQRAMERNVQAAGNRSPDTNPPRVDSLRYDINGRPLRGNNISRDALTPRVESLRHDKNGMPSRGNNISRDALTPRVESLRHDKNGMPSRGNNISRDALTPRSASLPLVRVYGASAANAGDRLLQNELVRNGNNRVDRVVQVSNGTNVDIESMRGEIVYSTKDKGKGRADSYIESSSGNSQNSGYFSSDISNNRGSNTSTYSQKSSERNSASGSSQLVKNDSYEHTNNRINQRRRNQ